MADMSKLAGVTQPRSATPIKNLSKNNFKNNKNKKRSKSDKENEDDNDVNHIDEYA